MLPLLLPHLGSVWSVLICPLFFGVAHLHHVREQLIQRRDLPASTVWLNGVFQLCYTSVFGAYSAWLFIRTGSCFMLPKWTVHYNFVKGILLLQ
eukprot:m.58935 g.58935  ORF g.58935 m.58935 type:complete len:94 (+) comp34846_c0_seq7:641-922(+)